MLYYLHLWFYGDTKEVKVPAMDYRSAGTAVFCFALILREITVFTILMFATWCIHIGYDLLE